MGIITNDVTPRWHGAIEAKAAVRVVLAPSTLDTVRGKRFATALGTLANWRSLTLPMSAHD